MLTLFGVWSFFAVAQIAAFYFLGFLLKTHNLQKYYILPKCMGSLVCIGTACMAILLNKDKPLENLLFWGLVLCLAGDFFIEYHLLIGGFFFGCAHCIMMGYVLTQANPGLGSLVLWTAGLLIMLFLFRKELPRMGRLFLPFLLYSAVLTGNFALAAMLPFTVNITYLPLALGLLSFQISDIILGKRQFGCRSFWCSPILMMLYYLALYLAASSLWFT